MRQDRLIHGARRCWHIAFICTALWLASCSNPSPTPFPTLISNTTPADSTATGAPSASETSSQLQTFQIEQSGFSIDLPADWKVEQRGQTPLGIQYSIGPEPLGPGPETSTLFVANANTMTAVDAAEALLCGDGCADEIALEEVTVGNATARHTTLDTAPPLEWFFLEHGTTLIFFSLHDPQSFATRTDLLETVRITEVATPTPEATATVSATETPTVPPTITIDEVREWRVVEATEAGLVFEVPARWQAISDTQWAVETDLPFSLNFSWQETGPEGKPEEMLPAEAEIIASTPFTLTWGSGISATVETETSLQRHVIVQAGLRQYDFYTAASTNQALNALQPVLEQVLTSVEIREQLVFIEDPVEGSIEFFQAVLRDPSGEEARPYLSEELQAEIPEDGTPMALLNLGQRFHTFNLAWLSGSTEEAVLEASLTLLDDTIAVRHVHLVYSEATGWRINAIEPAPTPTTPAATPTSMPTGTPTVTSEAPSSN